MALSTETLDVLYMRNGLVKFHQPADSLQCEYDHCIYDFARAIEAEVRKDDEALIRQMLDAAIAIYPHLNGLAVASDQALLLLQQQIAVITAARARLEKAP